VQPLRSDSIQKMLPNSRGLVKIADDQIKTSKIEFWNLQVTQGQKECCSMAQLIKTLFQSSQGFFIVIQHHNGSCSHGISVGVCRATRAHHILSSDGVMHKMPFPRRNIPGALSDVRSNKKEDTCAAR